MAETIEKKEEFGKGIVTKLVVKQTEIENRTMGEKVPIFAGREWRLKNGLNSPMVEAWAIAIGKEKVILMGIAFAVGFEVAMLLMRLH